LINISIDDLNSTRELAENDNFTKCYNKELFIAKGKNLSFQMKFLLF